VTAVYVRVHLFRRERRAAQRLRKVAPGLRLQRPIPPEDAVEVKNKAGLEHGKLQNSARRSRLGVLRKGAARGFLRCEHVDGAARRFYEHAGDSC
jgi:hypothetical protein